MTDDEFSAEELERQRRRRLIDQAKDTVARLKNREKYREEVESLPPAEVARRLIPAPEDPVAKWRREMAAIAEAHAAEAAELSTRSGAGDLIYKTNENAAVGETRADWSAWNAWADERIQSALDRERAALVEGLGEGLAQLLADERKSTMAAVRDQVRELKVEATSLRAEILELRTLLALERGKVVDMPSPLRSRVN